MLSNWCAGAALVVLVCVDAGAAARSACPQRLRIGPNLGVLRGASLYLGLPEHRKELKRAGNSMQWVLPPLQRRALASRDALYFLCRYDGTNATVTLPVAPSATRCSVSRGAAGQTNALCE